MKQIKPAELSWQHNTPISAAHDDVYYSKDDGLAESKYVFIRQNNLPQRWTRRDVITPFTIVETGFGSGLNFLATWLEWKNTTQAKCPIHFVSIEKHPLTKEDLSKAHLIWPELAPLKEALLEQYPELIKGQHLLSFDGDQVKLTLIFGDINEDFDSYSFSSDCWFLDGFAPSKNPDMWNNNLFEFMAQRSNKEATFATFTAAGFVKRGLQAAGFEVNKVPGHGRKREMLTGFFPEGLKTPYSEKIPRWAISEHKNKIVSTKPDHKYDAIIIGSGLSGITSAYSLANRGLSVALIEKNPELTSEASGQSQLAQYAKLPAIDNKEFRFTLHCLQFSQRYLGTLQGQSAKQFWHRTGLLQLAWNEKESAKQSRIISNHRLPQSILTSVDADTASNLSGFKVESSGLWFENCGWLAPKAFSRFLVEHENITCLTETHITQIEQQSDESWTVLTAEKTISAEHLIIATANATKGFDQLSHLPIKPLRGQVTTIESSKLEDAQCVLCGEGYLCPSIEGAHHIGATYDLNSTSVDSYHEDNSRNINSVENWLPTWKIYEKIDETTKVSGNAGLRCTTPDYMPIVGKAPVLESFLESFPKLRHNSNAHQEKYGHYYSNLYVNAGHGSKGLITTPLCAEYITALITGEPLPFDQEMIASLSPARFIIKDLIQRKR